FPRFIQNAVARRVITEVHTNRELVSFENHVSFYPNSANLFHRRSPFLCATSASHLGSLSHPAETGPLIPSDNSVIVDLNPPLKAAGHLLVARRTPLPATFLRHFTIHFRVVPRRARPHATEVN